MRVVVMVALALSAAWAQDATLLRAPLNGWIEQTPVGEAALFEGDRERTVLMKFERDGAVAVRVHFDDFALAAGSKVYVYGWDKGVTRIAGPYMEAGPLMTGEFWSAPVPGSRVVIEAQLGDGAVEVPFKVIDVVSVSLSETGRVARATERLPLIEGDIILRPSDEMKAGPRTGAAIGESRNLWPGGVIPYTLDRHLTNTERITDAVAHWNTRLEGHLRLQPRTSESSYIEFVEADPMMCSSYVGRTGAAAQPVYIGDFCSTGNVIHEIGHAIGLQHEHTRRDRDTHVRIARENIDPYMAYNFDIGAQNELLGTYDYGSIMHYGAFAFSRNGQPTIVTIPEGVAIGQRTALSAGDATAARELYPAVSTGSSGPGNGPARTVRVTISSNPSGRALLLDGNRVTAPAIVEWIPGSTHTVSAPDSSFSSGKYVFASWSDGGTQEHIVTTPNSALTLGVTYAMKYKVTASASLAGRGTVAVAPESPDGHYASNTAIAVTAMPAEGNCFSGWTGLLAINDATQRLTVNRALRITANFQAGSVTAPQQIEASMAAQTLTAGINATGGCIWRARTSNDWIWIHNPTGKSSAVLKLNVTANATGARRVGEVWVGDEVIQIVQQ